MHNHYYYSQTLSKDSSIDYILDPIIKKIRHDNIISFSQLKQTEAPPNNQVFSNKKWTPKQLPQVKERMSRTIDSSLSKENP